MTKINFRIRTILRNIKRKVLDRLKHKVNHTISNNEPLLCIGFQLPGFSLWDLSISNEFTKPVYFWQSQFFGKEEFSRANFQGQAFSFCHFLWLKYNFGYIFFLIKDLICFRSFIKLHSMTYNFSCIYSPCFNKMK
jgi:hypothetical protein